MPQIQQNIIGACISVALLAAMAMFIATNWSHAGGAAMACPGGTVEYTGGPHFEIGNAACVLP